MRIQAIVDVQPFKAWRVVWLRGRWFKALVICMAVGYAIIGVNAFLAYGDYRTQTPQVIPQIATLDVGEGRELTFYIEIRRESGYSYYECFNKRNARLAWDIGHPEWMR